MAPETSPPGKTMYDRMLDGLSLVSKVITGVSLVILTVIFSWLVFGRYVLNATPTWVEQASLLLVMLITFLGAANGIRENTHLGVSYFRDVAPEPVRKVFTLASHLVLVGFGGVMMWNSYLLVKFKWGSLIPLIHLPEGLRAIPIMVCGGLIMLYSIGHIIDIARGIEPKSSLTE